MQVIFLLLKNVHRIEQYELQDLVLGFISLLDKQRQYFSNPQCNTEVILRRLKFLKSASALFSLIIVVISFFVFYEFCYVIINPGWVCAIDY